MPLLEMLGPVMTDQSFALHSWDRHDIVWQWVGGCSVSCFRSGDQLACGVAIKVGCVIVVDFMPSGPVHSLRLPCSWVNVAPLRCCFEECHDLIINFGILQDDPTKVTELVYNLQRIVANGDVLFAGKCGWGRLMLHFSLFHANGQPLGDSSFGEVINDTLCTFLWVGHEGTVVSVEEVMQQPTWHLCLLVTVLEGIMKHFKKDSAEQ